MSSTAGEHLSEEPQAERGDPGSRNTGSDDPSSGETDRPTGSFDDESVPSHGDSDAEKVYGGTGTDTPGDAEPAVPPYDGRQESATVIAESSAGEGTGGAAQPRTDSDHVAPKPSDTAGGATASPSDEQPAARQSETDTSDDGVAVTQQSGVRRAEDQPRET